jgi:hypothetical protein
MAGNSGDSKVAACEEHRVAPPGLVSASATAARNPQHHDADDARRRARIDEASAQGPPRRSTWRHVEACLNKAATGGDAIDVTVSLKMVLSMEGVPYQTK